MIKKKVIDLNAERRARKPLSLEDAARLIFRKSFDPAYSATLGEEPQGLASGKTNPAGGFVRDDEDDLLADSARTDDDK